MKRTIRIFALLILFLFPFGMVNASAEEIHPLPLISEETPDSDEGDPQGILYEMNFYEEGFFGYGEEGNFRQWSLAHFIPILVMIGVIVLIGKNRIALKSFKQEEELRFGFIAVMILCEMSYFWRLLYCGPANPTVHNMLGYLPLQVCQWSLLLTSFCAAKKSKTLFSVCFFLTHTFGLLPLLFPAVITITGPAYYRYYQFWGEHILPIIAVYYMLFVHEFEVKLSTGIIGILIFLVFLGVPAIYVNRHVNSANYLYLKPDKYEMLNFLPKSELVMAALYLAAAALLCAIVYTIYRAVRKQKKTA